MTVSEVTERPAGGEVEGREAALPPAVVALLKALSAAADVERLVGHPEVRGWLRTPSEQRVAQVAGQLSAAAGTLGGVAERIEEHVLREWGGAWAESLAEARNAFWRAEESLDGLVEHLAAESRR